MRLKIHEKNRRRIEKLLEKVQKGYSTGLITVEEILELEINLPLKKKQLGYVTARVDLNSDNSSKANPFFQCTALFLGWNREGELILLNIFRSTEIGRNVQLFVSPVTCGTVGMSLLNEFLRINTLLHGGALKLSNRIIQKAVVKRSSWC